MKKLRVLAFSNINMPLIDGLYGFAYNGDNLIAISYTSLDDSAEKVIIVKENGNFAELVHTVSSSTSSVKFVSEMTVYHKTSNRLFTITNDYNNILVLDIETKTELTPGKPSNFPAVESIFALEQVESASRLIVCGLAKHCAVYDLSSGITEVSTFESS